MNCSRIIDFPFALDLKNAVSERFSEHLHFHDGCGGQYFSLEKTAPIITAFIKEYLNERGIEPVFSEDNLSFTLVNKPRT